MAYSPQDSFSSENTDISALIHRYEQLLAGGDSFFFETDTFLEIIGYYNEHLNPQSALEAITLALEQHPYCAHFYLSRAQILMDEGQYPEAQEALSTALRYEPTNTEFLLAEADLLQRNQRYDEASTVLEQVRQWADEDEQQEADILEATLLEAQQQYAAALLKLEQTALREPDNDWLLSRIWLCAEWADQRDAAIEIYHRIIDQNPYSCWAWYHLGYAFMELDLYEKAVEAFDYAIVIDELFELAYRDIIEALLQLEQFDEALRYLNEYANHFELDAEMHEFMGECFEGKGDSITARSYYVQSAQLNVRDGNSYFRLGGCYAKESNWKSALAAFELAHQTDANNEMYCLALAEAHYELNDTELAEKYLLLATEKAPLQAHTWLCYVEFLLYQQAFDTAFDIIEKAQLICDDAFSLECGKVATLFMSGRFQQAQLLLLHLEIQDANARQKVIEICAPIANHPIWKQWSID